MNQCAAETRKKTACKRRLRPPTLRCRQHRGAIQFREKQSTSSTNRHLHATTERELLTTRVFKDRDNTPVQITNEHLAGRLRNLVVTIDGVRFIYRATLGQGGCGVVISIWNPLNHATLAVKLERRETERDVSDRLYALNNVCAELHVRYIDTVVVTVPMGRKNALVVLNMHAYIMEAMDGSLCQMFTDIRHGRPATRNRLKIQEHHVESRRQLAFTCADLIRRQLLCLYERGFFYVDFKLANVMYKVLDTQAHRKKDFIVMLGDIGSMSTNAAGDMCTTYPPPEHRKGKISRTWLETGDNMRHFLSWSIGIFFGYVANIYTRNHDHPIDYNIKVPFDYNRIQVQKRVKDLFGDTAARYLARDPTDRPSISDTIVVLYE
jgi:hypothetical protein